MAELQVPDIAFEITNHNGIQQEHASNNCPVKESELVEIHLGVSGKQGESAFFGQLSFE